MRRFALVVVVASFAALAPAAPVPRAVDERGALAAQWGKVVGLGEATLAGKQLTVRSNTGGPVRQFCWGERCDMPRVSRAISGDFQLTVRLLELKPPSEKANHALHEMPATLAGLFVTGGDYSLQLYRQLYFQKVQGVWWRPGLTETIRTHEWWERGGGGSSLELPQGGDSVYLRVARVRDAVTVSCSSDGTKWSKPIDAVKKDEFPRDLTVGVFLANTTHEATHATFDLFALEPLKPEPKK